MSTPISQAISSSLWNKDLNSNLMNTISDDMNKWYNALKKTIAGGWNRKEPSSGTKSHEILAKNQITSQGEKRWQQWIEKRSNAR